MNIRKSLFSLVFPLATALCLNACAGLGGRPVERGDKVNVHYTCRLENGEVIATTYDEIAKDESVKKSNLFLPDVQIPHYNFKPVEVTVGGEAPDKDCPECHQKIGKGIEPTIKKEVALLVEGMRPGSSREVEITAEPHADMKGNERFIRLAKIRKKTKQVELASDSYYRRTRKEPEVGQEIDIDPLFTGRVTQVKDKSVVITVSPKDKTAKGPFGEQTIEDKGDHYLITVHAVKGTLVRAGYIAGRITKVGEEFFSVDFGHPFAGEKLKCDITVDSLAGDPKTSTARKGD